MLWKQSLLAVLFMTAIGASKGVMADDPWVVYEGGSGPGQGKHIVLVSGDEEYRSEESLSQLGKILAERHGFKCTVLFAIDQDGTINPVRTDNIPGLDALQSADLLVIATRFRNLPDDQMKQLVDYIESGRPIIGLRTATHAFQLPENSTYARYSWQSKKWDGGFGRQVLGETWVNHHGNHGSGEHAGHCGSRHARPSDSARNRGRRHLRPHRCLHGDDFHCPATSKPLVLGQVLVGMDSQGQTRGGR